MKYLVLLLILTLVACKPASQGKKKDRIPPIPHTATTIATLQLLSPTPEPSIPKANPTPAIKHVAPKEQPTPDQVTKIKAIVQHLPNVERAKWEAIRIKPQFQIPANKAVMKYLRNKARYEVVEKMNVQGVPAPVLFCLHYRESDNDFSCHPHEGSSLLHRTRFVPKGRLPAPQEPPYTWEQSAKDAYYACDKNLCDRMQGNWSDIAWAFNKMELFNGAGYRRHGKNSPYIYSGTQYYDKGKFVSDGHYSDIAVDQQLGCLAILFQMKKSGIAISFD